MWHYLHRILDIGDGYYLFAASIAAVLWVSLRHQKNAKRVALTILIPYMFLVAASTILSRKVNNSSHPILVPFWSVKVILTGGRNKVRLARQVALNILMLMPVGLLVPSLFKKRKGLKTVLLGLAISFVIELAQMLTHRGYAEIDDLMTNTLGVVIGYGIYRIFKWKQSDTSSNQ